LELLLSLKTESVYAFAEQLTAGFLAVTKTDMSLLSKQPYRWATLFRVLSISATHPAAATYSFELTCIIISDHPDSPLTAEHFGECVDLLLSFSSGVTGVVRQVTPPSATRAPAITEPLLEVSIISPKKAGEIQNPGTSLALERALEAIEKLYNLHLLIPKLIGTSGAQSQRGTDFLTASVV
jgi:hypothetical protein